MIDHQYHTLPEQDIDPEESHEEIVKTMESLVMDGFEFKINKGCGWEKGSQKGVWYEFELKRDGGVVKASYVSSINEKPKEGAMLMGRGPGIGKVVATIRLEGDPDITTELSEEFKSQFALLGYGKANISYARERMIDDKVNVLERYELYWVLFTLEWAKGPLCDDKKIKELFQQGEDIHAIIKKRNVWARLKGYPKETYAGWRLLTKAVADNYRNLETKIRKISGRLS